MQKEKLKKESKYFPEREVESSNEILPGKEYETRNGMRVRIYNVEQEIHGAVLQGKRWEIDRWQKSGKYFGTPGKDHSMDIVFKEAPVMREGAVYKSRDGNPVKLIALNPTSPEFPAVGVIKDADSGEWIPRVWNMQGITKLPFGSNNDIVSEWSEG